LLHVGQVRLVRLGTRRGGWRGGLLAGREAAPLAVPGVRDGGVQGEGGPGLMPVGAEERDVPPGRRLAALPLAHRTGAYPAPPDGITACCHWWTPVVSEDVGRSCRACWR